MTAVEKKIPLNVRGQIRDCWEAPGSPLRSTLASLQGVLGVEISVDCDWIVLWEGTRSFLKAEADLVPAAAHLVEQWARRLETKLELDEGAKWINILTDMISSAHRLRIMVEPWARDVPRMEWDVRNSMVKLRLSGSITMFRPWTDLEIASEALLSGFDRCRPSSKQQVESSIPSHEAIEQNGFSLPDPFSLPSPEVLFKSMTPYHLTITPVKSGIEIESTHEQSLELIKCYFSRYIRLDSNQSDPMFEFRLVEANFGRGSLHDRLWLSPTTTVGRIYPQFNTIPTLQLVAFVEGILGYTLLPITGSGVRYHFKRTSPFL